MSTLIDIIKPVEATSVEDAMLYNELAPAVNAACEEYRRSITDYGSYDGQRDRWIREATVKYKAALQDLDVIWRTKIRQKSAKYNQDSIVPMSYAGRRLLHYVGRQYAYDFTPDSAEYRPKLAYSHGKALWSCQAAVAIVYAKYKVIYDFQLNALIYKVLTECFDVYDIQPNDIDSLIATVKGSNLDDINYIMIDYMALETDMLKPTGKPGRHVKAILPPVEVIENYLDGAESKAEVYQELAERYGVSYRTIERHVAKLGIKGKCKGRRPTANQSANQSANQEATEAIIDARVMAAVAERMAHIDEEINKRVAEVVGQYLPKVVEVVVSQVNTALAQTKEEILAEVDERIKNNAVDSEAIKADIMQEVGVHLNNMSDKAMAKIQGIEDYCKMLAQPATAPIPAPIPTPEPTPTPSRSIDDLMNEIYNPTPSADQEPNAYGTEIPELSRMPAMQLSDTSNITASAMLHNPETAKMIAKREAQEIPTWSISQILRGDTR